MLVLKLSGTQIMLLFFLVEPNFQYGITQAVTALVVVFIAMVITVICLILQQRNLVKPQEVMFSTFKWLKLLKQMTATYSKFYYSEEFIILFFLCKYICIEHTCLKCHFVSNLVQFLCVIYYRLEMHVCAMGFLTFKTN